jgi:hypothetical protein
MSCKGICIRHKVKKKFGGGWYDLGAKRCSVCNIFIKWDEIRCPCCNNVLRTQPNTGKDKEKLRIRAS